MRIVIYGDRSRYEFFRFLICAGPMAGSSDLFFSERLSQNTYSVSSDKENNDEKCFYSALVPMNTILLFPKEYEEYDFCSADRVLYFNEFPWNRAEDIKKIRDIAESEKNSEFQVIIVCASREGLVSDISSENEAIEKTENDLKELGVEWIRYIIGDWPDFLLSRVHISGETEKRFLLTDKQNIERNLQVLFDTWYDLSYESELRSIVSDPETRKKILAFDQSISGKNVWDVYAEKCCDHYLDNSLICDFYRKQYKDAIQKLSLWNIDKDLQDLDKTIKDIFKYQFRLLASLSCYSGKKDYQNFLNENQIYVKVGNIIEDFFEKKLKEILKERIKEDITVMEELLNESNH